MPAMKNNDPYTKAELCPRPTCSPIQVTASRWKRRLLPAMFAIPVLLAFAAPHVSAEVAPVLYGVNLAGGESNSTGVMPGTHGSHYLYPNDAQLAYYQSKGLTLIRLPIKWRRIQENLGDPLKEEWMQQIDTVLTLARNRNMKVILDLHDYNEYWIGAVRHVVGSATVPKSYLVDLWGKIADRYKNETAIYGYDLMNEPKGNPVDWADTAQQLIYAIRNVGDTRHWILVEGIHSSRAAGWTKDGNAAALLNTIDPADKLIFSAHSYWDANGTGHYVNTYATDNLTDQSGVNHVKPFVKWCNDNGFNGLIGEYGIPSNGGYIAEWHAVLRNFMDYLKANNISGTYWCGGTWSANNSLTCEPTNGFSTDRPVMSVLQDFVNNTDVIVDDGDGAPFVTGLTGWTWSNTTSGSYDGGYYHDGNTGQGTKAVTFTPHVPGYGNYEVFLRWTAAPNRASNAPVQINHANGSASTRVDQQNNGGAWQSVGIHAFNQGTGGSVVLSNTGANGHVIADAVKLVRVATLPAGWTSSDVGATGLVGSSIQTGGVFTVKGAGNTIGGTADSFQFARKTVTGDCSIVARVITQTNTSQFARAGLMIRDGLANNAMHASAIVTPGNGLYMMSRSASPGSGVSNSGGAGTVPYWLKVTRVGDVFTTSKSTDGSYWVPMNTKTIAMGATVEIGLVVCAYGTSSLGSATFDNVVVTPP